MDHDQTSADNPGLWLVFPSTGYTNTNGLSCTTSMDVTNQTVNNRSESMNQQTQPLLLCFLDNEDENGNEEVS